MDKGEEVEFKFGITTPYIMFEYTEHERWLGVSIKEIYEESERLRIAVKKSIGYTWDNSHFRITDVHRRPILIVGFYEEHISFWNARTDEGLFSIYSKRITKEDIENLSEAIEKVGEGLRRCGKCGAWVEEGENYSFAGFVCNDCYDEKVHLPPNTLGD